MDRKAMTRKQRNSLIVVILSLPLFAGDIALVASGKLPLVEALIPCVLSFVVFFVLWFVLRRRDGQKVEGDERSLKIEGRAFAYSWYLSLYALILFMANDSLGLVKLSASQCLFLILAVMLASFWIIKMALNRRGDLEE
jgi:hypothetical protein